jgi:hypothetical protein
MNSGMQLVLHAHQLVQPNDTLITFYKTNKGKTFYLTGKRFAELLRKAIWKIHPDITLDNLKKYSAHSLRIWACVLLDKAGKFPEYIKKRLYWLSNSFRFYLRNTAIIQN